jgi:hypothetical protein
VSGLPGPADDDATAGALLPGAEPALAAAAILPAGRARAAGALGAWLRQQRQARSWNVPEMASRLRAAAAGIGDTLPGRATVEAHVRRWESGVIAPSERYKLLYCRAFGITAAQYGPGPGPGDGQRGGHVTAHPGLLPPPSPPPMPAASAGHALPRPCDQIRQLAAPYPTMAQPAPCCPALLAYQIAAAIAAGATCHCGHGHAAPHGSPGTARELAHPDDTIKHLITEAAHKRGADVTAIARVVGMTTTDVRAVLRSADTRA